MGTLRNMHGVGHELQETATNSLESLLSHPDPSVAVKALEVYAKLADTAAKVEIARMKSKVVEHPKPRKFEVSKIGGTK